MDDRNDLINNQMGIDDVDFDDEAMNNVLVGNDDNNISHDMVEENRIDGKYHDPSLWGADNLLKKMGSNMAKSESAINDYPLGTENTPRENE